MSEEEKKKKLEDVEELKEVLNVVSQQVPNLIRNIVTSVFSEQAGANMGKAVGAYYKGLKEAGIPEETAVRMTEKYASTFTSLGDVMKMAMSGEKKGKDLSEEIEISKVIKEKTAKDLEKEEKKE
ncbi:MAG: hypothetical protein JTT11_04580 [Candidatus Brockarchaeota archaeon]|nr:hypothetical protein [Candidatus Brockarchaeota archaeon]